MAVTDVGQIWRETSPEFVARQKREATERFLETRVPGILAAMQALKDTVPDFDFIVVPARSKTPFAGATLITNIGKNGFVPLNELDTRNARPTVLINASPLERAVLMAVPGLKHGFLSSLDSIVAETSRQLHAIVNSATVQDEKAPEQQGRGIARFTLQSLRRVFRL